MLDLYAWGTTNGRRALIAAEEAGLAFTLRQVNIRKGEQKTPEYEAINPYRKIPALVDSDGPGGRPASIFESVAICFYLAEKSGKLLSSTHDRPNVLKWSMFHATNLLPAVSLMKNIDAPALERSVAAQLETMNKHLEGQAWFAEDYSVADIIPFTRLNGFSHPRLTLDDYPNVVDWLSRIAHRPAVNRAMERKFE